MHLTSTGEKMFNSISKTVRCDYSAEDRLAIATYLTLQVGFLQGCDPDGAWESNLFPVSVFIEEEEIDMAITYLDTFMGTPSRMILHARHTNDTNVCVAFEWDGANIVPMQHKVVYFGGSDDPTMGNYDEFIQKIFALMHTE